MLLHIYVTFKIFKINLSYNLSIIYLNKNFQNSVITSSIIKLILKCTYPKIFKFMQNNYLKKLI